MTMAAARLITTTMAARIPTIIKIDNNVVAIHSIVSTPYHG
jgi:hypothetical protein